MTMKSSDEDLPPFPDGDAEDNAGHKAAGGEGDFRGHYGFGRPAHGSDPEATYVFRPARRALRRRGER